VAAYEIIAVLLVAVPAALLLALLVIERPRQLHSELRSVPLRPTGQLQEGMYRVTGRVRRGKPLLRAPVSGRPCLAWRLVVTRSAVEDDLRQSKAPLGRGVAVDMRACGEFWIEDDGGRAAVQPGDHFALAVEAGHRAVRGRWAQLPAAVRAEIHRHHGARTAVTAAWDPHPGAAARFTELTIEEDDFLSIGGEVQREPHPLGEAAPRAAPMRWTFRGTPHNPLILTDDLA
jgi:hypothetical protein